MFLNGKICNFHDQYEKKTHHSSKEKSHKNSFCLLFQAMNNDNYFVFWNILHVTKPFLFFAQIANQSQKYLLYSKEKLCNRRIGECELHVILLIAEMTEFPCATRSDATKFELTFGEIPASNFGKSMPMQVINCMQFSLLFLLMIYENIIIFLSSLPNGFLCTKQITMSNLN